MVGLGSRKHLYIFPSDSISRERVIRKVKPEELDRREKMGVWQRVYDTVTGELMGAQLVGPEKKRVDMDLASMAGQTTVTISEDEMQMNVQSSRTLGLGEEKRAERMANRQVPEDLTERVQCKVRVYARVGSSRGDILRVWPRGMMLPAR